LLHCCCYLLTIVTPADHWRIAEYATIMKNRFPGTGSMQELQLYLSQAAQCMLCPTLTSKKDDDISLGSWLPKHTTQELLPWLLLAGKYTHAETHLRLSLARTVSIQTHHSRMSTRHCHRGHHIVACVLCQLASVKKVYAADYTLSIDASVIPCWGSDYLAKPVTCDRMLTSFL